MSSEYRSNPVDPWSRFVSYCSVVVALGTLAWVYFGNGANRLPAPHDASDGSILSHVEQLFERESVARQQRDEQMRDVWLKQQKEQLAAYKTAADGMLAEHQTLIYQLANQVQPATFTSEVAKTDLGTASQSPPKLPLTPASDETANPVVEANPTATATADDGDRLENDKLFTDPKPKVKTDDDDGPLDSDGLGFTPLLAYVREARKPGLNQTTGLVTVRNRGRGDAIVSKVEFTPSYDDGAVFEVDSSVALVDGDAREVRSIVFSQKHNQAAEKGKHGIYVRDLADDLTVPAGQDVLVRLAVSNPKHLGWGFRGSLKISYNGFEPLVIEDAQLVFVGSDEATSQK